MKIIPTELSGVVIIEPKLFEDERGYFFESFREDIFQNAVAPIHFVQDNESCSQRGVVRGIHFQVPPKAQAKLVRVVQGEVIDVAVDLRQKSPTYGKFVAVRLSAGNKRQFFLPEGFGHGFVALSPQAIFQYRCSNYYAPECEGGIDAFDPDLGIDWGISSAEAVRSEKDRHRTPFKDFISPFL